MLRSCLFALAALPLLAIPGTQPSARPEAGVAIAERPAYTAEGALKFPAAYREGVYLTTGLDMNYAARPDPAGHSMFDNVFVNPGAYRAFLQNGTWPDGTTLVLELRGAESGVSINTRGKTQTVEVMGLEVHVKDAKLPGGWGFFEFDNPNSTAKLVPRPAACYTCHEQHAAVDTTFVQFYPTLIGLAKAKGTLSPAYLKELAGPAK